MGKWADKIPGLMAAAKEYQEQAKNLTDEDIDRFIEEDPEAAEYIVFGDQGTNAQPEQVAYNYNNMPNNSVSDGTETPPWIAGSMQQNNGGYTPMYPQQQQSYWTYGNNPYYNSIDDRYKVYNENKGMKFYNLNPMKFMNGSYLKEYYDFLEAERKKAMDQNLAWAKYFGRGLSQEEYNRLIEMNTFKPADVIVEEFERQKAEFERQQREIMQARSPYDENGYRTTIAVDFVNEKGEVVETIESRKIHVNEDKAKQYEREKEIRESNKIMQQLADFIYIRNTEYARHQKMYEDAKNTGKSPLEVAWEIQNEHFDFRRSSNRIMRAMITKGYSKERYHKILDDCCSTEINYDNRSNVFSMSYDFERDIHYGALENKTNDDIMVNKLKREYDTKKNIFMSKVQTGDFWVQTRLDATYHETMPKPRIDTLTKDDYEKPENNFKYTEVTDPRLEDQNVFMPDVNMSELIQQMSKMPVAPGSLGREVGHVHIDDDGTVFHEKCDQDGNYTSETFKYDTEGMTQEELMQFF